VSVAGQFDDKPLSVGRPLVVKSAVTLGIGRAVGNLTHFLGVEIHHHELAAILDEGYLLAVGRILGIGALYTVVGFYERSFIDECRIGEVGIVFAVDFCHIYVGMSLALACVGDCAVVGSPCRLTLGGRSRCNLLGGGVFNRCYKQFASIGESHLLAVGRYSGSAGRAYAVFLYGIFLVEHQVDIDFAWCGIALLGVYLAVVGECECSVGSL